MDMVVQRPNIQHSSFVKFTHSGKIVDQFADPDLFLPASLKKRLCVTLKQF
jgi:hypothetical protein